MTFSCLSILTLFLYSYHLSCILLVSICVLGYGWKRKRLDFDTRLSIFLEEVKI